MMAKLLACRPDYRPTPAAARGLTLVELLVVLTILAILAGVAVVSTDTVIRQGRFEATQQTLAAIEQAVLGPEPYRSEDGRLATAGFVADIGRLPEKLEELWEPLGLPAFGFVPADADQVDPADADPDVVIPSGWRGPYLRLPIGRQELRDGWGNLFELEGDSESGEEIVRISSVGPDLPAGDPAWEGEELAIVFRDAESDRARTAIQVTVWQRGEDGLEPPSGTGDLVVRLFSPKDGGVDVVATDEESLDSTAGSFVFSEVPIGTHVIRAYVTGAVDRKSPPLQITVHPLRSTTWQLVLPSPSPPPDEP